MIPTTVGIKADYAYIPAHMIERHRHVLKSALAAGDWDGAHQLVDAILEDAHALGIYLAPEYLPCLEPIGAES